MNSLPGNPHGYEANIDAPTGHYQVAQALLTLAHEQRTATLVNVVRMYAGLGMAEQAAGIIDAITDRLGGDDHE